MVTWIQAHAFLLLQILGLVIFLTPIVANVAIRILHRVSTEKGDRYDRAANFLIAKAPLVLGAAVFLRDVIVHPEKFAKIQEATALVQSVAAVKDDADVAIASARLAAAVEGGPVPAAPKVSPLAVTGILCLSVGAALFLSGCGGAPISPSTARDVEIVQDQMPLLEGCAKGAQDACDSKPPEEQAACRRPYSDLLGALSGLRFLGCVLTGKGC